MINAEKLRGKDGKEWYKIWFRPNKLITDAISKIPGAMYSPVLKVWAVPASQRNLIEHYLGDFIINWVNEPVRFNGGIDEESIPDQPIVPGYSVTYDDEKNIIAHTGFKTRPWGDFQVRGFNLLVERDFLILADDAGLGKTWQVATAMEARKKLGHLKRGIVLVKASLIYNWRDEIHMHTNERAVVAAGTVAQRHKLYSDLSYDDSWTFLIMSYETFRVDIANIQLLDCYKPLDFCICDEAHKFKNPTSRIGSVIHQINFKYRYVLTATPLPNTPLEAYNYLRFGKVVDMNWWQFQRRFAILGGFGGKEVVGYKNIKQLQRVIQAHMLRRRKQDKLKDLPEVTFKTIRVPMTREQAKLYEAVKKEIMEELVSTNINSVPSALTKLLRLQQITDSPALIGAKTTKNSSAKLIALDELLEDLIDNSGEKVIVFSKFKSMIDILAERYKKYNPAIVHGEVDANGKSERGARLALKQRFGDKLNELSEEEYNRLLIEEMTSDRQKEVYRFQNDPECKLWLGCTPACREGLTLTAATHVIFLDLEWSYAYFEQAFSRAHRIGQKNNVTVYTIVCEGTVDEYVQQTVESKQTMAQRMIDEGVAAVGLDYAIQFIKQAV